MYRTSLSPWLRTLFLSGGWAQISWYGFWIFLFKYLSAFKVSSHNHLLTFSFNLCFPDPATEPGSKASSLYPAWSPIQLQTCACAQQTSPSPGQGAAGTNWSTGSSIWTWGRTCLFWGWWITGTGCPEGLWSLLLWRYSKPTWTWSRAACCRWPCFGRGVELDDPQRSLPTPTILWFCNSFRTAFFVLL